MIRLLSVYWNSRQCRMAIIAPTESGEVKALTFKLHDVGRTMEHITWKRGIPHGWTLWKEPKP